MSLFKKASLSSAVAAQCLIAGVIMSAQARADIPDYFFKQWTVSKNCSEQHAGVVAEADPGLQFQIVASPSGDGSFDFQGINNAQASWSADWNAIKLEYRAGTPLTTLPADFACVPGQEASSPFLAMSGYVQTGEPYYQQEHWYGLASIAGQLEHVLIFPRTATDGGPAAVIVMESATSGDTVKLDENGVIHAQ